MKKKLSKLAASIGVALTQPANADATIDKEYLVTNLDVQLYKQPLNMVTPIFLAAHGSHSSHGSHGSHGSHRSSSGGAKKVPTYNPLGTTPKLKTSYPPPQACPDYLLSLRKSVVRQVQYYLIALNYIKYSDVYTFGVIGYETRKAIRDYQKMHGISQVSGTTLDNKTLGAMGISCY